MSTPSTREQILEYLRLHPLARVNDLAQALQVTPSNIRHHLSLLQEAGLVVAAPPARPARRGRPPQRYRLTPKAQSSHLEPLTRALLTLLRQHEALENRLDDLGALLLGEAPLPYPGNLRQRLQQILETLNALGYEAHWEAHQQGPLITFRRCPFATLRDDFPELCRLDQRLLERALDRPVEVVQSASEMREKGPAVCRYRVRLSRQ